MPALLPAHEALSHIFHSNDNVKKLVTHCWGCTFSKMTLKVLIPLRIYHLLLCRIKNVTYHIHSCKNDRLCLIPGTEVIRVLLSKCHITKTIFTFSVFVALSSFSFVPSASPALILQIPCISISNSRQKGIP